jgi:hypothetical protein
MKITKHSLDHIELIASGDTALFEVRLIVAMQDWSDDEADAGFDEIGALGWLMNLLHLAAQGEDIKTGAEEFLKAMMTLDEQRVYLARVERISMNEEETK